MNPRDPFPLQISGLAVASVGILMSAHGFANPAFENEWIFPGLVSIVSGAAITGFSFGDRWGLSVLLVGILALGAFVAYLVLAAVTVP